MGAEEQKEDQPFVMRIGPIVVDVPRTVGYYGGLAAAIALDLIGPELALFIAAVPLVKLLKRQHATKPERAVAGLFEGAMKPVGGDAESVVRPSWVEDEKRERARKGSLSGVTHELAEDVKRLLGVHVH
jgi:hypothetical protein